MASYKIIKWLLKVSILITLLTAAKCMYIGDNCSVNNQKGVCKAVEDCPVLVDEVTRAGSPMPTYVRRQLRSLSCGFNNNEPLICCIPSKNFVSNVIKEYPDKRENKPNMNTLDQYDKYGNKINERINIANEGVNNKVGNKVPVDVTRHVNFRLLPTDCGVIESDRIWGGNTTGLGDMPWMVLLAYDSPRGTKLSCGGTLITDRYVLTAAHCVSFLGSKLQLASVIVGEYDIRTDPDCERIEGELQCAPNMRNITIESAIPHPGYTPQTLFDDIALVRLSRPADFSLDNMKPICLPYTVELQQQSQIGSDMEVAGWGATEDGLQSPVLLSVSLPVISNSECETAYKSSIHDTQLCAGGVKDRDSCGGDSGGPLMSSGQVKSFGLRKLQWGIVSYGSKRCGIDSFPGVYTRVSHYIKWILDNIRE